MNWLGYVLFEPGPSDEQVYRAIASHLCSALENTAMAEALEANYLKLMDQAFREGLSDVVSHMLHHAGNAFNSVHASVQGLSCELVRSPMPDLMRAESLLGSIRHAGFPIQPDAAERAARLLEMFRLLGGRAVRHRDAMLTHLARIEDKARLMDDMITLQQGYAVSDKVEERVPLAQVLEDALRVHESAFPRHVVTMDSTLRVGLAHVVPRGKAFVLLSFLLACLGRTREKVQPLHIDLVVEEQQVALRFSIDRAAMEAFSEAVACASEQESRQDGLLQTDDVVMRSLLAAMRQLQARLLFDPPSSPAVGASASAACILIVPDISDETGVAG
jgi:hypothetical protein